MGHKHYREYTEYLQKALADLKEEEDSCKRLPTFEEQFGCLSDLVYQVTRVQDKLNISLMKFLNTDEDPRWIPIHAFDNLNAMMLSMARNHYNPKFAREGYFTDKFEAFKDKLMMIYWRLN